MKFLCLALIISFFTFAYAVPPNIVSSVYKEKVIPFEGKYSTYRVHEVEFDQDLYMTTNWACDCRDPVVNNCSNKNISTLSTTDPYETLAYDTWSTNHSLLFSEGIGHLYKIDVDQSIYTCPDIDIITNSHWGPIAFTVSNTEIPDNQKFEFVKAFSSTDRLRICNSDPRFRYGTYFIYVYLHSPTIGYYDIKFKLSQASACSAIPNYGFTGTYDPTTVPLPDSVMQYLPYDPAVDYLMQYELLINQRCSNISITSRTLFGATSVFITVSFTRPDTNLGDQATWPYKYDGLFDFVNTFGLLERNIVIPNFCYDGPLPLSVFIGLQITGDVLGETSFIATTDNAGFDITPISDYGFHQAMFSMGTHAFSLFCGADKQDNNGCELAGYASSFGYDNGIPSCAAVQPALSIEGKSPNFPRPTSDLDYGLYDFMFKIEFPQDFILRPNATRNPRMITVNVYYEGYTEAKNEYMRLISKPYDTCALGFYNKFVNNLYENPSGTEVKLGTDKLLNFSYVTATAYSNSNCTTEVANALIASRAALLDELRAAPNALAAQFVELKLSILHAQDDWIACQNYVDSFFNMNATTITFTGQAVCTQNYNRDEFFSDPCCDWGQNEVYYCPPADVPKDILLPQSLSDNTTKRDISQVSQCGVPECVELLAIPYVAVQAAIIDPVTGCNAKFVLPSSSFYVSFIYQCQVDTVGDDLQGSICVTDADCKWGGSCVNGFSGLRCNHTANDTIRCFSQNIDPDVGQYMFSNLQIREKFSPEAFFTNFQPLFVSPDCYGPDSKIYQKHYHYGIRGICSDGCTDTADCFATSDDCPLPICDTVSASGVGCARSFTPKEQDLDGCTQEFNCNWFNCEDFNLDAATCQAWCSNSSLTPQVCLDCSSGTCVELPGLSAAQCNTGYCSAQNNITDPVACAALTSCTVSIPRCNGGTPISLGSFPDAPTCNAQGMCTSQCLLEPYVNNGGVCLEGPMLIGGPSPFCNPLSPGSSESVGALGCASTDYLNESVCITNTNGADTFNELNLWRTIATDEATCLAEMSCYQPIDPLFDVQIPRLYGLYMDEAQCNETGTIYKFNLKHKWQSVYEWTNGDFNQGYMIPYLYVDRSYRQVRSVQNVVNYTGFRSAVEAAISVSSNIVRSSYETCLYDSFATYLGSVACDCQGGSNCYQTVTPILGQLYACPFIGSTVITPHVTVTFYNTTVDPVADCDEVSLYAQSINLYTAPTGDRLTSDIFYYQRRNIYSIVTDIALLEGQTVSNLVEVHFPSTLVIANPFEVCIDVIDEIPVDPSFTVFDMGILRQNPTRVQATRVGVATLVNNSLTTWRICANVTESGGYFAVRVDPYFHIYRTSIIIQCAFSSFLFMIATILSIYYVYCFFFYYVQVRLYFKCILSVIIFFFCIIRMVYWIVIACGGFDNVAPASLVLFELPTFLFLVMFSCVIYLWADFQVKMTKLKPVRGARDANKNSWFIFPFLGFEALMIICGVVLLIVYYTIPTDVETLPCAVAIPSNGGPRSKVSLAYAVTIAFFGLLISLFGLIIGARFTKIVFDMRKRQTTAKRASKKRIAIYTALGVGIVFAICFIIKGAITIAFVIVTTVDFPIILFSILEIIPTFALMFYIAPAKTPVTDSDIYTNYMSTRGGGSTRGEGKGSSRGTNSGRGGVNLKVGTGRSDTTTSPQSDSKVEQ